MIKHTPHRNNLFRRKALAIADRTLTLIVSAPPTGSQILPGLEGVAETLLLLWTSSPPGPVRRALEAKVNRAVEALEAYAKAERASGFDPRANWAGA